MKWLNGHVYVDHPRVAWTEGEQSVIHIHCLLDQLKGTSSHYKNRQGRYRAAYDAAKNRFDLEAAFDIVERVLNKAVIERIADAVADCPEPPRVVFPHPAFDDENAAGFIDVDQKKLTNALPFAYARYLADRLGCEIDEDIDQVARVGRTKLGIWLRFLCQPSFMGDVRTGSPYIIVDDTLTTGGTFAALRSYILRQGGTVIAVSALAHKEGRSVPFQIAPPTLDVLLSLYGSDILPVWREATGHELQCLTEAEGRALVQWARDEQQRSGHRSGEPLLQHLRTRINSAAATGR